MVYTYLEKEGGCYKHKEGTCVTPGEGVQLTPIEDYTYIPEKTTEKKFILNFEYKDGILNYQFLGDKNNQETVTSYALVSGLIITQLIEDIIVLNEIPKDKLATIDNDIENYTLEKNGMQL